MRWPTPDEFNEAVQNPQFAFTDPELATGRAVVGPLGIPLPYSGAFADVYQFECGKRTVAVKCFTRPVDGLEMRYAAIADRLKKVRLGFTVGFEYLPRGIRHNDAWYPAVKMDWVAGVRLNEFIAGIVEKPKLLSGLIRILAKIGDELDRAEVGHGDLQHGNVLLIPAKSGTRVAIRLVDYDGMWVPDLANDPPGEVGHPDYQHPGRAAEGYYGPCADRFSLLAIAAAVRGLIGGAELWKQFDTGTNVLFREADFLDPHRSPLFAAMLRTNDPVAMRLVAAVAEGISHPIPSLPRISDVLAERHALVLPALAVPWLRDTTIPRFSPADEKSQNESTHPDSEVRKEIETRSREPVTRAFFLSRGRRNGRTRPRGQKGKLRWSRVAEIVLTIVVLVVVLTGLTLVSFFFASRFDPSPIERAAPEARPDTSRPGTLGLPSSPVTILPFDELTVTAGRAVELAVRIERQDFHGPVTLQLDGWPTASEPVSTTLPEGKTEGMFRLPATPDGETTRSVNVTVQVTAGSFTSHHHAILRVLPQAAIRLGSIETVLLTAGERRKVTIHVTRVLCDGPITVRIPGLPKKVNAPDVVIPALQNQIEVEFSAHIDAASGRTYHSLVVESGSIRDTNGFSLQVDVPRPVTIKRVVGIYTAETIGHSWHYTFTKPGDDWIQPNYKDADKWKIGKGAFGFINSNNVFGLKRHLKTKWSSSNIWLRTEVELPLSVRHSRVVWRFYHDDDISIYINGERLLRRTGFVTDYITHSEERTLLKPGKNIVAVTCHNEGNPCGVDVGFVWEKKSPANP